MMFCNKHLTQNAAPLRSNHIKQSRVREMSVSWLTLKMQFTFYLNSSGNTLEQNLKNRMTNMQQLMNEGISQVQDHEQLKKWLDAMFQKSNELYRLLSTAPNINTCFTYEQKTLRITDVVDIIADKIESLDDAYHMVDIGRLKQNFVFDNPVVYLPTEPGTSPHLIPNASLAQLFHALQKLNGTPCISPC